MDHDCNIGDYVHIGPHVTLCDHVLVETGAYIAAGAIVLPGITIGAWSKIGAGVVVNRHVLPGTKMDDSSRTHYQTGFGVSLTGPCK